MDLYLPDISVIVCAHNHGMWLERCIRSLNHQLHLSQKEFEIIVINDASNDNTDLILENVSFISNLRVGHNDKNIGLPLSLNKAIKMSRGRYIVRVDSDDYVARIFLYMMRTFLDMNKKYQAVVVDYSIVDRFENIIDKHINCADEQIACGVMFRKECLIDIGLYDPMFQMREGHDLMHRFKEKFEVARIELPLYKYRKHDGNRTNDKKELLSYDQKLNKTEKE